MICLVLNGKTFADNKKIIELDGQFAGLFEYRFDTIKDIGLELKEELAAFISETYALTGLQGLLTLRLPRDGGFWKTSESERLELMRFLLSSSSPGAIYAIDLEIETRANELVETARQANIRIIRSAHNFEKMPSVHEVLDLEKRIEPDAIFKFAGMGKNLKDLNTAFELCKELKMREKIILLMGEFGSASRILYKKFGSLWTYSSIPLGQSEVAAPGQLSSQVLQNLYGAAHITEKTQVFGILGDPIAHSKSPQYHNNAFRENAKDAVYIPIRTDDIEEAKKLALNLDIQGLSITIPHKEAALSWGSEFFHGANLIGASNTLWRNGKNWAAGNTDTSGFYGPLEKKLEELGLKKGSVLVLGAGGASRACVYELWQHGFEICIANRTLTKAQELAEIMGNSRACNLEKDAIRVAMQGKNFHIIVNTTSLGMEHGQEFNFDDLIDWTGVKLAYDIIYTPPRTPFLASASKHGVAILNGEAMFTSQAKAQSLIFQKCIDSRFL